MVVGKSKVIGTVVANAANTFSFQLPAGVKNGTYTLVVHVLGAAGSPEQVSTPLSFKVGPIPKVKAVHKAPGQGHAVAHGEGTSQAGREGSASRRCRPSARDRLHRERPRR